MFGGELRVPPPGLLPMHGPAQGEASEDGDGCVWQFHLTDAGRAQGTVAATVRVSPGHTPPSL